MIDGQDLYKAMDDLSKVIDENISSLIFSGDDANECGLRSGCNRRV